MKTGIQVILNLKDKEVMKMVEGAGRDGMLELTTHVMNDAVKDSPYLTGNNRRSIAMEVSGKGSNTIVNPSKIEGAVYSTSGYGGFLETGTVNMAAKPYIKPAIDRWLPKLADFIKGYVK